MSKPGGAAIRFNTRAQEIIPLQLDKIIPRKARLSGGLFVPKERYVKWIMWYIPKLVETEVKHIPILRIEKTYPLIDCYPHTVPTEQNNNFA